MVLIPPEIEGFQIDFAALEEALGSKTKAVLVNSPNNPSGVVYSEDTIRKLSALMEELMECITGTEVPQETMDNGLSVITNEGVSYGAAAALDPGVLGNMAEEKGADLLLIPSSVHEFLVLADDGSLTKEEMEALIRDVNRSDVPESDVLSNHLYRFDRKTGEVRRA